LDSLHRFSGVTRSLPGTIAGGAGPAGRDGGIAAHHRAKSVAVEQALWAARRQVRRE